MSNNNVQQDNTTVYQGFMVKEVQVPTPLGSISRTYICISQDEPMVKVLQDMTEIEELYNEEIMIQPQDLYPHLKSIQDKVNSGDFSLIDLTVYLNEFFKSKLDQL
jgi:hypothetical protein